MEAVEDPTQPLTRDDIDRLRRRSAPYVAAARRPPPKVIAQGPVRPRQAALELAFIDSLEAFDHIGYAGTPANMITSEQCPTVHGEFEVARLSLAELALVIPPPPREHWPDPVEPTFGDPGDVPVPRTATWSGPWLEAGQQASQLSGTWTAPASTPPPVATESKPLLESPRSEIVDEIDPARRRRAWPWMLPIAGVAAALVAWQAWPQPTPEPPPAPPTPTTVIIDQAPIPEEPVDFERPMVVDPIDDELIVDPGPTSSKDKPTSAGCRALRDRATAAFQAGAWVEVESTTRRKGCWKSGRSLTLMRVRALFELKRFDECIRVARRDNSEDAKKWKKTCEDAKS
ncbi:hypothetical protein ACNOYE_00575 [Nannocystaceae bacterium ST9]